MIHITTPLSLLFRSYLPGTGRTAITTLLCFFRRGDCVRAIPWTHQTWINVAVFRYFQMIRVYYQLNKLNKLRLYTPWMNIPFSNNKAQPNCVSFLRRCHTHMSHFRPFRVFFWFQWLGWKTCGHLWLWVTSAVWSDAKYNIDIEESW